MSRTIESPLSLNKARDRILAHAEPGESIEVSLGEASGLILAESVVADVDHPPCDRASHDGYAVRSGEAVTGAFLRIVTAGRASRAGDFVIEAGEAGRVLAGDPLPLGSDSVIRPSSVRPDPEVGATRVVEVLRSARPNRDVILRGAYLTATTVVAEAGTRIQPASIPLLASQGCVHPLCHRRVRVSILTIGHQWVRPDEAPTINRERNATNVALAALTVRAEAMAHDFQAVAGSLVRPTLERATISPVMMILGSSFRATAPALREMGYEPVVDGIAMPLIGRARYGVIRDDEGAVINHVFHLPASPVAASVGFLLLVQPLIARLQGVAVDAPRSLRRLAAGEAIRATGRRACVRPAIFQSDAAGQSVVTTNAGPLEDLVAWSRADGFVVLPERSGPWRGGDLIEWMPIGS